LEYTRKTALFTKYNKDSDQESNCRTHKRRESIIEHKDRRLDEKAVNELK